MRVISFSASTEFGKGEFWQDEVGRRSTHGSGGTATGERCFGTDERLISRITAKGQKGKRGKKQRRFGTDENLMARIKANWGRLRAKGNGEGQGQFGTDENLISRIKANGVALRGEKAKANGVLARMKI